MGIVVYKIRSANNLLSSAWAAVTSAVARDCLYLAGA